MKRRLLAVAILLLAVPAYADRANSGSSRANLEFSKALSAQSLFGVPSYTTANLPACTALLLKGAPVAFDTTTGTMKVCNGTSWSAVSGMSIGGPVSGGGTNRLLYEDSSQNLAASANGAFDGTALSIGGVPTAANAVSLGETAGCITWEGPTSDAFQGRLCGDIEFTGADTKVSIPNTAQAVTMAVINFSQSFSGTQTFTTAVTLGNGVAVGSNEGAWKGANTVQTPDGVTAETGTSSNAIQLIEKADTAFDFQNFCTTGLGTAACTDPSFIIHSHNQDTGEALAFAHDSKGGVIAAGNSTALNGTLGLGYTRTLTEASATTVYTIPVASGAGTGGSIEYTVFASDATDHQSRGGMVHWQVVNKGGTETCVVSGFDGTANPAETKDGSSIAASTGTLTYTWGVDTTGTNTCALTLNATSSLTQTTLRIDYHPKIFGPGAGVGS